MLICAHKLNGLRYGAISALGKKVAIVAAKDLQARLKPLIRKTQPYAKKIAHRGIWVEPSLLAEIEYRGKSAEAKCGTRSSWECGRIFPDERYCGFFAPSTAPPSGYSGL